MSTLLCYSLLDKLSDDPYPNRFLINKLLALVARRDSGGAEHDDPYYHHANVGILHYKIGQYDKAYQRLSTALSCAEGPDQQAEAVNNLAYYALIPLGQFAEAIELVQEVLPESKSEYHRVAWLDTLGQAYTGAKDLPRALAAFKEAMVIDTPPQFGANSQILRIHSAEAFALSGDLASAKELCNQVFQIKGHALDSYMAQELVERLLGLTMIPVGALKLTATQEPEAGGFITSRNSRVFHWKSCPMVRLIDAKNQFVLASREDARNKGLRACKYCNPDI